MLPLAIAFVANTAHRDTPERGFPQPSGQFTAYGYPLRTDGGPSFRILENTGYLVGYDEERENPAWAAYSFSGPVKHKGHVRKSGFSIDDRTKARVKDGEYDNSGYSRGHMAPSFGIFSFFGDGAKRETYLMSNVVPQKQALNGGPWEDIEDKTANVWAAKYDQVWTIDGPVYQGRGDTLDGTRVAIPSYTFKIVFDMDGSKPRALAFLMPQTAKQTDDPAEYLVTIDEIEEKTHLDFFTELPNDIEEAFEAAGASELWN